MIEGLKLIEPALYFDDRGYFLETYQKSRYESYGIMEEFLQDNHSYSVKGVIRGMHFHSGQAKLVSVIKGEILDVAVDIRPHSESFGKYEMVRLSSENHRQLYLPDGFAHGFCVLSDDAYVVYKLSAFYDPSKEKGFRFDDPDVQIGWPIETPILSERDRNAPLLKELSL